jgi:hypothetical protein
MNRYYVSFNYRKRGESGSWQTHSSYEQADTSLQAIAKASIKYPDCEIKDMQIRMES